MKITRKDELVAYQPKGHYNMIARRAHSAEIGDSKQLTIGYSVFHPNGGAEDSTVPNGMELVYYIVSGEMELTTPEGVTVLKQGDSALFRAGDVRSVKNITDQDAGMLVISAVAPK